MDSQQLQSLIMENLSSMPNKARRVCEYLLGNMREAAFRSISEVANDLAVSKAQLVRVARMLGFAGYAELKDCLQHSLLEQVNPAAMLAKVSGSHPEEELPESIFLTEQTNLDDTWKQLSAEKIKRFCSLIRESTNIYCLGWGISSLVTELLQMRFCVMGLKATLLRRGSLSLTEQVRPLEKGDIVVVCELPSYSVETTEAVMRAQERGAKIVTITDNAAAPVCRYADLSLFASTTSPTFGSSILGPLLIVHVLTSAVAVNFGESVRDALGEQAAFLHDERTFYPIFGLKY